MPSSYTHQLIAERVAEELPENVKSRLSFMPEYFLGAQGGDIFYFYNMAGREKNVGKYFHRRNIYGVFSSFLQSASACAPAALCYMAGYITHYAADTVFHPYVYWLARTQKQKTGRKKDNIHARSESDFDSYFVQKIRRMKVNEYEYPVRYGDLDFGALFPVLKAACAERELTEKGLRRAVRRFFRMQEFFSDRHLRRGKALYGLESVLHAPHFFSGLYRREHCDEAYLNRERGEWHYPADPEKVSHESVDELFGRSVKEGVRLICAFFIALDGGQTLSEEDFGKHFLTGLPENAPAPCDEKGDPVLPRDRGAPADKE